MKSGARYLIALVTAPDIHIARRIAKLLLEQHLVACANLVPSLESHYWWENKIESDQEVLLILKTTNSNLRLVENVVSQNHPYDTPEIIALPLKAGSTRYLNWITASVADAPANAHKKPQSPSPAKKR